LDRKAQLRHKRFKEKGTALPALREEVRKAPKPKASGGPERLQKILSAAGVTSRRKAEELILLGHVSVNGKVVNTLGAKADPRQDVIQVDGKAIDIDAVEHVYYVLNKPRGYVTTTEDPQGRPTVMDLMKGIRERVYPVGRLDYASEGLILFTNDGDLANRIMHPSSEVERTYAVKVKGSFSDEKLRELRDGIHLKDGLVKPRRVQRKEEYRHVWIYLTLTEGKNLEIRRLFSVLEVEIERLRRVAIGSLEIGSVPVGKYRRLLKRDFESMLKPQK
jgi:23S rRNA pseudouridine2605 synthase